MKLLLVRHCETDWNAENRIQGYVNRELNARGREQAGELAKEIESFDISRMISSDLKRAAQTANILNTCLRVPLLLDKRLRECSFGKFEGLTWPEVEGKFNVGKESFYQGEDTFYDLSSVGGESRDDVIERHMELVKELWQLYPDDTLLLVGHGTGLNTLLHVLGYPISLKRGEYREVNYIHTE